MHCHIWFYWPVDIWANEITRWWSTLFVLRLDGGPEMWEGLRGAVCGVAQAAGARRAGAAAELREALALLRGPGARPAADHVLRTLAGWAHQARIPVWTKHPANSNPSTHNQLSPNFGNENTLLTRYCFTKP